MTIKIEIKYDKFFMTFSGAGFKDDLALLKTFSGRQFHKINSDAYWTAPINAKNIGLIRSNSKQFFNPKIIDDPKQEIREYDNEEKHHIDDDKLIILEAFIHEILPILRPYQVKDVAQYLINYNILNANEMGLGKTIETGAFIYLMRNFKSEIEAILGFELKPADKVLIVVPASLKRQWNRELKEFFKLDSMIIEGTSVKRAKQWNVLNTFDKKYIIITNYENLRTKDYTRFMLNRIYFDVLICDEITRCKNFNTDNFKRVANLHAKKTVGLTGTPIENHLKDIFTIMKIIHPTFFGEWREFKRKYLYEGGYMGKQLFSKRGAAEKVADELKNFWGFIRWKRESVLDDLPELLFNLFMVELTPKERKEYTLIDREVKAIRDKNGYRLKTDNILAKMLALRRLCSDPAIYLHETYDSAKKKEFVKVIQDNLNGKKILVFSQFEDVIFSYAKALKDKGIPIMVITGSTKPKLRDMMIETFKNSETLRILLATDAFSYGHNLQFCSVLINIDMHWNPAVIKQRVGRIDRIGQKESTINVISFLVENTIEDFVYHKILDKNKLFDIVITENEDEALYSSYEQYITEK